MVTATSAFTGSEGSARTNEEHSRTLGEVERDLLQAFRDHGYLAEKAGQMQEQNWSITNPLDAMYEVERLSTEKETHRVREDANFDVLKSVEDDMGEDVSAVQAVPEEDKIAGSNDERARKQDRDFGNQNLLLVPGQACFNSP